MSEILFIRHADTDMAGTFCGHSDPELNARGRARIRELVDDLHAEQIDAVYSSDLRRAHSTAQAIASAFGVVCHVRPALREIYFGQWDGLTWQEIEQRDATYARRWLEEYPNLPAPDGEMFRDFERRILDEVEVLRTIASDGTVVVVAHAGVLRSVLLKLCGCSEDEARERTKSYGAVVRYTVPASSATDRIEVLA
jgi:broad specificity phosphatase PhoE